MLCICAVMLLPINHNYLYHNHFQFVNECRNGSRVDNFVLIFFSTISLKGEVRLRAFSSDLYTAHGCFLGCNDYYSNWCI